MRALPSSQFLYRTAASAVYTASRGCQETCPLVRPSSPARAVRFAVVISEVDPDRHYRQNEHGLFVNSVCY